jgi:mRNA interferase HigB
MRVIKRGALVQFCQLHPDEQVSLGSWYAVVRKANWTTPAEMKQVCGNADLVGRRTVFNIAGNKYQLVGRVNYIAQIVFVLKLLTHAEYDNRTWKR